MPHAAQTPPCKRHAVAEPGHGQLADAGLQERSAKVALGKLLGLLQEPVGLVAVGQVGRRDNQVLHLPGQPTQHVGRGGAGGEVWLVGDFLEVQGRQLAREEQVELLRQLRIGFRPFLLLGFARGGGFGLLLLGLRIEVGYLGKDDERRRRVAAQVGNGFLERRARLAQRHAVRGALALEAAAIGRQRALAHDGLADDQARLVLFGECLGQGGADLVRVVAVNGRHAPAPGFILLGGVLVRDGVGVGGELDIVGIVEHDQVAQAEEPGDAACALRNLFLHAPVRNEGKGLVRHPFAKPGTEKPLGDGRAHRAGVALPERAGGVLHAAGDIQFGMAGRGAAPLAEVLQLVERVVPAQRQHRVEHRRHVARVQKEPVPHVPGQV